MKNLSILSLLILSLLFFNACKKDDDSNSNNNGTFSCGFLKVGNIWTYEYQEFFSFDTLNMQIVSESNGVYELSQSAGNNSRTEFWYTDGAFLKVYSSGESKSSARRIFKCGAAAGDNWTEASQSNPGGTITYKVVDTDTSVSTYAGVFDNLTLIELSFSYASNKQYNYWSEIHGQVYQDGFVGLDLIDKNF